MSLLTKPHIDKIIHSKKILPQYPDFTTAFCTIPLKIMGGEVILKYPLYLKCMTAAAKGISMVYGGKRIAGINWETRHDNLDGSRIEGWHSHEWTEENEDHTVIAVESFPPARNAVTMEQLLDFCCKHWYITIEPDGPFKNIRTLFHGT